MAFVGSVPHARDSNASIDLSPDSRARTFHILTAYTPRGARVYVRDFKESRGCARERDVGCHVLQTKPHEANGH